MENKIMNREHPGWMDFSSYLYDRVYINERNTCRGDYPYTTEILSEHFPDVDVPGTIEWFQSKGGHCDCETGFNICAGEPITGTEGRKLYEAMKQRGEI